ncbi:aspartyl/glutamyl-tRNA amidotransferase subunit A [Mycoplasmopsis californica]|uniref:Amidase family protein n=1 Tax=Mycoplasmopsis equigenitalium TaxID=114883 RepID=A0ABY5J177_9BACT|nr:amidase family protein [Mycoplasmopsis equigenitalium]UUD37007.1 amidase family protein [Mycoplasmopsis equigenitalium]VEU69695.1 aspartyl/glutamyl-tRNA amidotransferase subunit A [Mycoplasmopsis californica]
MLVKGDIKKALKELKNDNNNAVMAVLNYKNSHKGILENTIFTIKDVFATDFEKTQASSKILENFEPGYTADCVRLLIEAGATPVAKVHNDELALGGTGTFSAFGIVKNPLDSTRYVGGSSCGSAATLTKNIGFALGSDTGDSVRLPASFVGKVGYKPSYGAVSRYGMFPYASSLDTVSYFAHDVSDIATISKVLFKVTGNDMTNRVVKVDKVKLLKPKKIAVLDFRSHLVPYVKDALNDLTRKLKYQQISLDFVEFDTNIANSIKAVYDIISYSEASSNLANLNGIAFGNRKEQNEWQDTYKQTRKSGFGKMVQRRLTLGSLFLKEENQKDLFLRAAKVRRIYKDYMNKYLENYDLVIYPASNGIAPKFDSEKLVTFVDWILTGANLIGNPSLTIPFGKHNNLPFSLAIDSKLYNDEKLLSYALFIEKVINFEGGK